VTLAGKHDDQVDALGLIGQLLDTILPDQLPAKPKPKPVDTGYRPIRLGDVLMRQHFTAIEATAPPAEGPWSRCARLNTNFVLPRFQ
jgi:hypothetical protein